jgi:hypothetical protein
MILLLTGALLDMYYEMRLCSSETVVVPYPIKIAILIFVIKWRSITLYQ